MDKFQALELLNKSINQIEKDIQNNFYYLEQEELEQKPSPEKWNIVEVFAHLSYTHSFYLAYLKKRLNAAEENATAQKIKRSWLGLLIENGSRPAKDNRLKFKMKTFKKIDPIAKQKDGVKIIPNIVFQDFNNDLTAFKEIFELIKVKDINGIKTATFIPYGKVHIFDALFYLIAHIERHIIQAKALIN